MLIRRVVMGMTANSTENIRIGSMEDISRAPTNALICRKASFYMREERWRREEDGREVAEKLKVGGSPLPGESQDVYPRQGAPN